MKRPTRPALAMMARAPLPGQVKTRLQPHLSPEESASLYHAFVRDAIELAALAETYAPFLFFTPRDQEPFFKGLAPSSMGLVAQREGDLGQRMLDVFVQLGDDGYSPIVIIGTDIPTLQPGPLAGALKSLDVVDVCLGPSHDGGYYLIGARSAHRSLFEGMPWSTPQVLEATLARARAAGLSVALLDACTDVDTIDELRWLRGEIEQLKGTKGARVPRWTEACLGGMKL